MEGDLGQVLQECQVIKEMCGELGPVVKLEVG